MSVMSKFLEYLDERNVEAGQSLLRHGTDVEVLMAKSHLFRDPIGSQKFQAGCMCRVSRFLLR